MLCKWEVPNPSFNSGMVRGWNFGEEEDWRDQQCRIKIFAQLRFSNCLLLCPSLCFELADVFVELLIQGAIMAYHNGQTQARFMRHVLALSARRYSPDRAFDR